MTSIANQYVVDTNGNRVGIILDFEDYQKLLSRLEELEEIHAFDLANESGDDAIALEKALAEIESART